MPTKMLGKIAPPLRYQVVVRGYVREVATDSATDSDFLPTSIRGQLWDAEHENDLSLNFQGHRQGQIQVKRRGTGYRPEITFAAVPKWCQTIANLPEQLA